MQLETERDEHIQALPAGHRIVVDQVEVVQRQRLDPVEVPVVFQGPYELVQLAEEGLPLDVVDLGIVVLARHELFVRDIELPESFLAEAVQVGHDLGRRPFGRNDLVAGLPLGGPQIGVFLRCGDRSEQGRHVAFHLAHEPLFFFEGRKSAGLVEECDVRAATDRQREAGRQDQDIVLGSHRGPWITGWRDQEVVSTDSVAGSSATAVSASLTGTSSPS